MSTGKSLTGRAAREDREKRLILKHRFENRITVAKYGKESMDAGDYGNALKKFMEYFSVLAEVKGVKDMYSLRLNHFDPKKELTEMLMISHVYFEMARMYDAVPKFHDECRKCLGQFVHFSANQPYQVVNSEMVRKHLKKSKFKNPDEFRGAYQQIFVQSKKCYVVTFCYGDTHPVTQDYRLFKDWLLDHESGRELVRLYYKFSSVAVSRWESNPIARAAGHVLIKPLLLLFSKVILPAIIKKC
jgi:hypothetical protein